MLAPSSLLQLIWRHTAKLRKDYRNIVLDALIMMGSQVLQFGYFLPMLGVPAHAVGATLIGSILLLLVSSGYSYAFPLSDEIERGGVFSYFTALPLSLYWVILSYLIAFIIDFLTFGIPAILCAILLQMQYITLTLQQLIAAFLFFTLSIIFFGTFFIMLTMQFSARWYRTNTWARILGPLMAIGASYVSLHSIYSYAPFVAYALLLNPFTYPAEGLRATLLGLPSSIPTWICTGVLVVLSLINMRLIMNGLCKKLNPVIP